MKLVCKALAKNKFALPSGLVEVDENGVIEVDKKEVIEALKQIGFVEAKASKEAPKEAPKAEEVKEETKRFNRK